MRARRLCSRWSSVRSVRFRRIPFRRDVAFDPGGATAPRVTVPHMLPSTLMTGSASATLSISRLNPTPQRIAVYASQLPSPTTTQQSYRAARYGLTRAGLPPAGTRQLRLTHHRSDCGIAQTISEEKLCRFGVLHGADLQGD